MLQLSLRNLLGNKIRFAFIGLAITLGVSFVVAALGVSSSFQNAYTKDLENAFSGEDLLVEFNPESDVDNAPQLTPENLATVKETPGVAAAVGILNTEVDGLKTASGDSVSVDYAFAGNWVEDPALQKVRVVEGAAPGEGEFVADSGQIKALELAIGESYDVETSAGTQTLRLSGAVERVQPDGSTKPSPAIEDDFQELEMLTPTSTLALLTEEKSNNFQVIIVQLDDGATVATVQNSIQGKLGDDYSVRDTREVIAEIQQEVNASIGVFRNVLLGFAAVSVVVSSFIIYNTFAMVLAQRTREVGLLRAIGAGAGQVRRSVMVEALVIGLLASLAGLGLGLALQAGLLSQFGSSLSGGLDLSPTLTPGAIFVALLVGVGVTVLSAVIPSIRAGRVSPIIAMLGIKQESKKQGKIRNGIGLATVAGGLALGALGVSSTAWLPMTVGALALIIGVVILGPLLASLLTGILGWPFTKLFGLSGQLAAENARRNARRTATTATALMIGLTLIITSLVVGESVKSHVSESIESKITADFALFSNSGELEESTITEISELDETGEILTASLDLLAPVEGENADESNTYLMGATMGTIDQLFDLEIRDGGTLPEPGATDQIPKVLVPSHEADRYNLAVGDVTNLAVESVDGSGAPTKLDLEVAGIYEDELVFGYAWVMDQAVFDQAMGESVPTAWMATKTADGFTSEQAKAAVSNIVGDSDDLDLQDRAGFNDEIRGAIDQLLLIVSGMLALSILIAFIGIGLTLALSVFERTRELGLLRAVGMHRTQMRRMVRSEAVIISLFGATLGLGLGLIFGTSLVAIIPDQLVGNVVLPVGRLTILTAAAGLVGLVAAILPAYRASRLDVLKAISVE